MSESVQQDIYKIITANRAVGAAAITPASTLKDLGVDSLEVIEILFEIEEHFDIHLPDQNANFEADTVQGLIDAVDAALAAKTGGVPSPA